MKKVILKIDKECTTEKCPIPPELLPNVEKGVKKVTYNNKTERAEIEIHEKLLSEKALIEKLRKIGYKVKRW